MFNLEYRFTHTYVDKFSKPFHKSIALAEKDLSKLTTQTVFAVDKVSDSFKSLTKNFRSFSITPKVDKTGVEKDLKQLDNSFKSLTKNFRSFSITPKVDKTGVEKDLKQLDNSFKSLTKNFRSFSITPKVDKTGVEKDLKQLDNSFKSLTKNFRSFSITPKVDKTGVEKDLKQLDNSFKSLTKNFRSFSITPKVDKTGVEKDLKQLDNSFKSFKQDIESRDLNVKIKPDMSEVEKVQNDGIRLNMLIANINTSDIKEQLLSYSESLYESTKYGLKKIDLGKEIATQVKSLDGLASLTDIGNAVVSGLKAGIRGSEKELAEYGKQIFLYKEITGKSFEESAQVVFKLRDKYKLTSDSINEVINELATLRKNFKITEDSLVEALDTARNEFGYLIATMDKPTKSKFIDGVLRWSTSLQQMHVPIKDSMDIINKALSGDQNALRLLSQGGLSISQIQNALQSGDIESIAKGYQNAVIKIGNMLKNASPIVRKQYMEFFGLTEDMASAFIEASNNAQEFRKQTEKAFNIKVNNQEAIKQINDATNVITKGINKIKNEAMATTIDVLPSSVVDAVSSIDYKDVALYGLALKGLWNFIGGKISLPKFSLPSVNAVAGKVADVGSKIKGSLPSVNLSNLGKAQKVGLAGAVVGSAIGIGSGVMGEGDKTEKISGAVGSIAGSTAGSIAGATIGSFILPGVGTAIGGFLGSLGGGFIGDWVGKKIGGLFDSKDEGKETIQAQTVPQTAPPSSKNSENSDVLSVLYLVLAQLMGINANTSTLPQIKFLLSQSSSPTFPSTPTSVPVIYQPPQYTKKPQPKGKDPAGLPPLSSLVSNKPTQEEIEKINRAVEEELRKRGFKR